jgi:mitochondrial fission protein ELM1
MIWMITDGRRGHERQAEGLAQALGELMPVSVERIPSLAPGAALMSCLRKRFLPGDGLPPPDIIVGAGHGVHISMLGAQRSFGGRTVVLMKPSLPLRCFDLCLIPEHDAVAEAPGVLLTRGALNTVKPANPPKPGSGLILVGGPSKHYLWDEAAVLQQIEALGACAEKRAWIMTTSPRTPQEMLPMLREMERPNLRLVPVSEVDADWLPLQLAQAEQVWVTPDSVSMLYEALTAGAAVGVFDLQAKASSRIPAGIARLAHEQQLLTFAEWRQGKTFMPERVEFNEAARCARWIKSHWFPEN